MTPVGATLSACGYWQVSSPPASFYGLSYPPHRLMRGARRKEAGRPPESGIACVALVFIVIVVEKGGSGDGLL